MTRLLAIAFLACLALPFGAWPTEPAKEAAPPTVADILKMDAEIRALVAKREAAVKALNAELAKLKIAPVEALGIGRQGPPGPRGPPGPKGDKGDKGDPSGGPVEPPIVKAAHVTFVSPTAETAGVVNDAALRAWLKAAGVKVHVIAAGETLLPGFAEAIAKAGGTPCVIVQDADGKLIGQAKLTTAEAVKELVK